MMWMQCRMCGEYRRESELKKLESNLYCDHCYHKKLKEIEEEERSMYEICDEAEDNYINENWD